MVKKKNDTDFLSTKEKAYYASKLREAEEIVDSSGVADLDKSSNGRAELIGSVFKYIASPLIYYRENKRRG